MNKANTFWIKLKLSGSERAELLKFSKFWICSSYSIGFSEYVITGKRLSPSTFRRWRRFVYHGNLRNMALNESGPTRTLWQKSASFSAMLWAFMCVSCTVWVSRAAVCPCERPELCQHIRTDRDFEVDLASTVTHSSFIHLNLCHRTAHYWDVMVLGYDHIRM